MTAPASRIYCSVDTTEIDAARRIAGQVAGTVGGIKLGLEFFIAQGPAGIRAVVGEDGPPLFLDLKLHDIPNTVAGGVRAALPLKPAFMTIHSAGGPAMMRAAAETAATAGAGRPKILAVTVLTSHDAEDLAQIGLPADPQAVALRLAALAQDAGMDGVVCSAQEATALRRRLGPTFLLVTPGIRSAVDGGDDQRRTATPAMAIGWGASYLVVGRPITRAADPLAALEAIDRDVAAAQVAPG